MSLGKAIREGHTTALEAMEASLAAAERHAAYGALSWMDAEAGLAAARAFDADRAVVPQPDDSFGSGIERPKGRGQGREGARPARDSEDTRPHLRGGGPFPGVPFLVKDLGGPFVGIPVHAGSAALARRPGAKAADSALAARFHDAGLVPFGRTTVPEFGLSLASEPAAFPPVRNPLDPSRTAGGSSGGAAAAVALGIVALAHATDAGGSIRVPAACCGLIGLKPSRGAVPQGPDFGNHLMGLASELVIARSVYDIWEALSAAHSGSRNWKPGEFFLEEPRDPRLGLLLPPGIEAERARAVEAAARHLEAEGCRVETVEPHALDEEARIAAVLFDRAVSVNLAALFDALAIGPDEVEPLSAAVAERGRGLSGVAIFEAMQDGLRLSHRMARFFTRFDALLLPMLASAPPPLGSFPTDGTDVEAQWRRMAEFAPFATLANAAGLPAVTLPFGADAAGLPLPVQILGPIGSDFLLLNIANLLAFERPFAHRFPVAALA